MALLEKVVNVVPTETGKKLVDRNLMPIAGAGGIAGLIPFLVAFLYKKVPSMVDFMPETVFLSATIGVAAWLVAKMDLSMSGWNWFIKGDR